MNSFRFEKVLEEDAIENTRWLTVVVVVVGDIFVVVVTVAKAEEKEVNWWRMYE